jgi:hypothetical protein
MHKNTELAQEAVRQLAENLDEGQKCDCHQALATALVTNRKKVSKTVRKKLGILVDKYLPK